MLTCLVLVLARVLTSASYADRQDCRIGLINIEYNCVVVVWCRTLGQVSRLQSYIKPALSDNGWCDRRPETIVQHCVGKHPSDWCL